MVPQYLFFPQGLRINHYIFELSQIPTPQETLAVKWVTKITASYGTGYGTDNPLMSLKGKPGVSKSREVDQREAAEKLPGERQLTVLSAQQGRS